MERLCQFESHNKPFDLVCTNPTCKSNRLLCVKCLDSHHSKCLNYIVEVDDTEKRTLSSSINWIRSEDVQKAISTIDDYGLETFEKKFFKVYQDRAEEEFTKLIEFFIERIQQAKIRVLDHIYDRICAEKQHIQEFDQRIKGLYNFDALLGIVGLFNSGESSLEQTSHDLSTFLTETHLQESQNKELHTMARRINNLNEQFTELEPEVFENFKACIPFQMFVPDDCQHQKRLTLDKLSKEKINQGKSAVSVQEKPIKQQKWTWDAHVLSQEVALSADHLTAKKTAYYSGTKQPILGGIIMANGHHQWEIDLTESSKHKPCFVSMAGYRTIIGIIDKEELAYIDDLDLDSIIGLSLGGNCKNMEEVQKLETYQKKKFMLDLNLHKGSFSIFENGLAICVSSSLKGRQFVPIVVVFCVHDKIKLNVLFSVSE